VQSPAVCSTGTRILVFVESKQYNGNVKFVLRILFT